LQEESKVTRLLVVQCIISLITFIPASGLAQVERLRLSLVKQYENPVITVGSPGAEGNKHGFEGGRVMKLGATYHLFVSEMAGDPFAVKMKLAHWTSADRLQWRRVSTLFESSGEFEGKDARAALWAPMPVYNQKEGRWNLFYVAYRSAPNTKTEWLNNYEARIWRAVSKVKGMEGIGGPYADVGVVLEPGPESQSWEGLQGTDSFFPYEVNGRWYGFYGSADTGKLPIKFWGVGLASAPELAGPWKRLPQGNPLPIEKVFTENPIVTKLDDGACVAVFDTDINNPNAIGYTLSSDGVHWTRGVRLIVQPRGKGFWADVVRTPLGLIPEGNGTFTLFYTGFKKTGGKLSDASDPGTAAVGLVTLKSLRGN
jgi:hypothetical protein